MLKVKFWSSKEIFWELNYFQTLVYNCQKSQETLEKQIISLTKRTKKAFTVIKEVGTPKMLVDPSSNLVDKIDTFRQLLVLLGM